MQLPTYNAAPIAKTFIIVRTIAVICMLCVIGLTANFVAELEGEKTAVPGTIVATLAITCIGTLYTLLSLPFFYSQAQFGLLVMGAGDTLLVIGYTVLAVVFGEDLSSVDCSAVGNLDSAANAQTAWQLTNALGSGVQGSSTSVTDWAETSSPNCWQSKATWGLCTALAVLCCAGATLLAGLWVKTRRGMGGKGGV